MTIDLLTIERIGHGAKVKVNAQTDLVTRPEVRRVKTLVATLVTGLCMCLLCSKNIQAATIYITRNWIPLFYSA